MQPTVSRSETTRPWWALAVAVVALFGAVSLVVTDGRSAVPAGDEPAMMAVAPGGELAFADIPAVAAERIAEGHLDARAPGPPTDDELSDLTATFNEMADELQHTEERRHRLLGDVAHELRTPLATIEGYLEGFEDGVVEPDESAWRILRDASHRLGRLVDDLGLVSRAEEGRLDLAVAPVDVADLVTRALRASAAAASEAGIELRERTAGVVPGIEGDDARLGQVLANLLANAIRHTPRGGTVTVAARQRGQGVEIAVTDTGTGIAPVDVAHVFERFYRADPARSGHPGSGIGLTISRAIAHAHGGELVVDDTVDAGARFVLWLPATT